MAASAMIRVTHLDGEPFVLNADLIAYVESRPDTFVTLTTGARIVVKENLETVLARSLEYKRRKHWMPPLPAGPMT